LRWRVWSLQPKPAVLNFIAPPCRNSGAAVSFTHAPVPGETSNRGPRATPADDDEPLYPGHAAVIRSPTSTPSHQHASTGAFTCRMARRFLSWMGTVVRRRSSRARTSATSWCGGTMTSAYQLACVVDDAAMQLTEVVRGADLLKSTARQCCSNRALGRESPGFFHCPLMTTTRGSDSPNATTP